MGNHWSADCTMNPILNMKDRNVKDQNGNGNAENKAWLPHSCQLPAILVKVFVHLCTVLGVFLAILKTLPTLCKDVQTFSKVNN